MRLQTPIEKQNEIRDLLEENLKYSKDILKIAEKTKSYLFWNQVQGWLKLVLILAPIILGIIYLPPLIAKLQEQMQGILEPLGQTGGTLEQLNGVGGFLDMFKQLKN